MARMDPNNPVKRIFSANPEGKTKVGRPKIRWLDYVERDLEAMGVRNWKNKAIARNQWKNIINPLWRDGTYKYQKTLKYI